VPLEMTTPEMTSPGPLTSWTGWDVRGGASADPGVAEAFERQAPQEPAEARYELIAVAARGFRPPRFLRTVELPEVPGPAPTEEEESDGAEPPGLRETWSLRYRRIMESGPLVAPPYAIYLLGVNPPGDATQPELEVFNEFYNAVHLPEVVERRKALRAVRYELVEEIRAPYQGAPRFLAAYEVDQESASNRRHQGRSYSPGPDVWQRHKTPWRLWYRRLVGG
jgi:hypothetical protein